MKLLKKTFIILGIFVTNIIIYYVFVDYVVLPKISRGNVEVYLPVKMMLHAGVLLFQIYQRKNSMKMIVCVKSVF